MKFCGNCGGRNATGAGFCQNCGAPFRVTDAESLGTSERYDAENSRESSGRSLQDVAVSSRRDDAFGDATKEFASAVGTSVLTIVVAFARWFYHIVRPLARMAFGFAWGQIKTTFSPASTWRPDYVPNFLLWGVLGAVLWRLPTSLVGIVYAVLANEARRSQEFKNEREHKGPRFFMEFRVVQRHFVQVQPLRWPFFLLLG